MVRIAAACLVSVALYAGLFVLVLDRPLTLGLPRLLLDATIARGAAINGPKLVILAGSNGPYSHRCQTIEPILGLPCINGGVAVGIGLDYLFARWQTLLRAGDVVYLPLEQTQYARSRAATLVGPDAAIMARHDRTTLASLPADRWLGAMFAFDLRALVMSAIEITLTTLHFRDPRAEVTGSANAWGDHVGHTAELGAVNAAILATARPEHLTAQAIETGDGTRIVRDFLAWAAANDVHVIGGLPTGFADTPPPEATLAAIRAVYEDQNARFLQLPNNSRYERFAFFDTPDHLHEAAQIVHSIAVGRGLAETLGRPTLMDLAVRRRAAITAPGSASPTHTVMVGAGPPSTTRLKSTPQIVDGGSAPAMTRRDPDPTPDGAVNTARRLREPGSAPPR